MSTLLAWLGFLRLLFTADWRSPANNWQRLVYIPTLIVPPPLTPKAHHHNTTLLRPNLITTFFIHPPPPVPYLSTDLVHSIAKHASQAFQVPSRTHRRYLERPGLFAGLCLCALPGFQQCRLPHDPIQDGHRSVPRDSWLCHDLGSDAVRFLLQFLSFWLLGKHTRSSGYPMRFATCYFVTSCFDSFPPLLAVAIVCVDC